MADKKYKIVEKPEVNRLTIWLIVVVFLCCNGVVLAEEAGSTSNQLSRVEREADKGHFACVDLEDDDIKSKKRTSVGPCIDFCWKIRKYWALLRKGDQCSCINKNDQYKEVDTSKCNKRCVAKNKWRQNCGGKNHFSKYSTGYVKEPDFDAFDKFQLKNLRQGCFKQKKALTGIELQTERLEQSMCIEFCLYKQFKYAIISNGDLCKCISNGNGYFAPTKAKCSVPCSGNKKFKCGGTGKTFHVYKTGYHSGAGEMEYDKRFEDLSWANSTKLGKTMMF
ncbi:hypothetical protein LOTGIDRAFT_161543 [Lottia gigantea]|uniref:WSC domain-containing protein n=1 Tax=Lottia gigantea TaxID=225164 RepID=V4AL45_LOTGI|nr:hypothetical protein LOTGIDRAFT_161543 [Lottia gigantea]ESO94316.1 hypothetical protein LOTGIDRAFT_161543 [Lottia gigantea]